MWLCTLHSVTVLFICRPQRSVTISVCHAVKYLGSGPQLGLPISFLLQNWCMMMIYELCRVFMEMLRHSYYYQNIFYVKGMGRMDNWLDQWATLNTFYGSWPCYHQFNDKATHLMAAKILRSYKGVAKWKVTFSMKMRWLCFFLLAVVPFTGSVMIRNRLQK